MNLRHIDPRSTEWMETIEEVIERDGGDDEEGGKIKAKSSEASGTGARFARGSSADHPQMTAPSRR